MTDSTGSRVVGWFADLSRREAAALGTVAVMALVSHLVVPVVAPGWGIYAQYATYLAVFSVWMAWFVDWLAVWLGQDPHPSELEDGQGDRDDAAPGPEEGAD